MANVLAIAQGVLSALGAFFVYLAARAKGEKEKREAYQNEAETRAAQQEAKAKADSDRLKPGAIAKRMRGGKF